METTITNATELRSAVAKLTSSVNNMCNTNDMEEVIQQFLIAKDLLLDVYKYNTTKLKD